MQEFPCFEVRTLPWPCSEHLHKPWKPINAISATDFKSCVYSFHRGLAFFCEKEIQISATSFRVVSNPFSFHLCSKQAQPSFEVHIQIMPKRTQYLTDCATYLKQLFRIKLSGHSSERLHHWPCHSISQTANRTQSTIMSDAKASRFCRPSRQLIKSA